MTQPQPPDPPPSSDALEPEPKPRLDLPALYPACFDWTAPRPLKIGITTQTEKRTGS